MNTSATQIVGGRLFGWSELDDLQMETLSQASGPGLRHESIDGDWMEIVYTTAEPLLEDDQDSGTLQYRFIFRKIKRHAILVSPAGGAVVALLGRLGLGQIIHQPDVSVDTLIRQLVKEPHSQYVVGALFAKVHGFGQALRSIALWGADVGSTRLFGEMLDRLYAYRLELRDVRSGAQVLSIDSHGELSFMFNGKRSLDEVTDALRFLTQRELIAWPI